MKLTGNGVKHFTSVLNSTSSQHHAMHKLL